MDADRLSLDDARNMISAAGNNINLSISNLEDQELRESEEFAKAVAVNPSDAEDTDTELSREAEAEVQHSEASELDISEVQHSEASADSVAPRTETSIEDTSGHVRSERSEEESMPKVSKSDEVQKGEDAGAAEEPEEEYVDVRSLPLLPPRPAPEPERAQRRCWHPVMLDTNPPPIIEESTGDEEYPHKKTLRNIRKLIAEKKRVQPRKHYQEVKTSFTVRLPEDNPKTPEPEKTSEPDLAVTLQLRTMQRQLQQLVQLPAAIQATLQAVSSHLDNLLPAPAPAHLPCHTPHTVLVQSDDSGEFLEEDYSDSLEALSEEEWSDLDMEALQRPASQSDSAPSPPPTPTGDELEKTAKLQKMETLNKCWPWADAAKPIYKIAEHYEPVYARCINNKVKWLEEKISEDQILAKNLKGI